MSFSQSISCFSIHFIFLFFFIFKLYTIVLVLPNIKMNPPQLFFFPQLFVKPPQPLCLLAFVFVWHGFVHCLMYIVILHCSLKKTFLSLLAILWNSAFSWVYISLSPLLFTSLLSSAICKASCDNHFAFWLFSLGWFCSLPPVQYYKPLSIVLQVLFTRFNPLNFYIQGIILE